MRGERPSTMAALASYAPDAVSARDTQGLTPFHWLWVRFISKVLSLEDDGRSNETVLLNAGQVPNATRYNTFTALEQPEFDEDIRLIRRLDPPANFLHMRHIPAEVESTTSGIEQAKRIVLVLQDLRRRHNEERSPARGQRWTRLQAVCGLFWTKVVSLLDALKERPDVALVHIAFSSPCCPPPVAYIVGALFPDEMVLLDSNKNLPVHIAAAREPHTWDWPSSEPHGLRAGGAASLLRQEKLWSLRVAVMLSPREALRVADGRKQLVLHIAIARFVETLMGHGYASASLDEIATTLGELISRYPESLLRRDGVTKLPPFLQAVALTSEHRNPTSVDHERNGLALCYLLLRENPTVLTPRT